MRELEIIAKQVEVTALSVGERLARIHDALQCLRELTLTLDEVASSDPASVRAWFALEGFELDSHGYYERQEALARAREGKVDPRVFTLYVNEAQSVDPELCRRIHSMRSLGRHLESISERLPGLAWLYYQDRTGFALTYPMHDPCTVVPPDFDWHEYITYRSVHPDNNPERRIRWTPPNIDYGGKGLMVAVSIPVYDADVLCGVWSFDVPVSSLVEGSIVDSLVAEQQSFIIDSEGVLIAHDSLETLVAPKQGDVYRLPISELDAGFADLDLEALAEKGQAEVVNQEGVAEYVVARRLPILDWLLVATFPKKSVFRNVASSFLRAFEQAKGGDLEYRVPAVGDEADDIVQGYNEMADAVQSSIEERSLTLEALEESHRHARALFESSPVGLALVNLSGVLLDMNTQLERVLALELGPSSPPDTTFNLLVATPMAGRREVTALLSDAIANGQSGPLEVELTRGDLEPVPVRLVAQRLERDGKQLVLVGVEDITERRRLQAQLLHNQKVQAIGTLAGGVAHDFNNLLTTIMGNASLLALDLAGDADKLSHVDSINLASERAAGLTAQLLSFSRRQVVRPRRLDLTSIVSQAKRLLERLLEDNVGLVFKTEPTSPVRADEGQLLQVVVNLVVNARDALVEGGTITVALSSEDEGGQSRAVLVVSDEGVGMDETTRARVFEPFFTTKPGGTGLGLATVHDIVMGLGGEISIESAPGKGTSFTVTIPTHESTQASAPSSVRPRFTSGAGLILLVDDEAEVREVAARGLSRDGLEVRTAANGSDALTLLRELLQSKRTVSLLLTDLVMPGIGGRELSERARQLDPTLPVLFMSGYTDDTILHHGVAADAMNLVHKPFSIGALTLAVRSAMRPGDLAP